MQDKILSFKEALVYGIEQQVANRKIPMPTLGLGDAIGGLRTDDFVVVTARGGTGKTYLLLQIAHDLSTMQDPRACGFLSGEMSVEDLVEGRLLKMDATSRKITAEMAMSQKIEIVQAVKDIPMYFPVIDERWPFATRCVPVMDFMREKLGVKMFFMDHMKYFYNEDALAKRVDERLVIEQTVLDMRLYAKKHGTPIFLAVQPKQISSDEEVTADSLKGTSAIGQDASVTLALDRPRLDKKHREETGSVYTDYVSLKIEKARHGGGNKSIKLKLNPDIARFELYKATPPPASYLEK